VWTVIALGMVAGSVWYGEHGRTAAMIIAVMGVLLFGFGALKFAREALSPRELLVAGPDGIDQRAVSPHAMIPWKEIADIRVIQLANHLKMLGITVHHPELLPHRGQLGRVQRSPWLGRGVKAGLVVLGFASDGVASGIGDAFETISEDTAMHATLEIPTVALELCPDELVAGLRRRWIAAGGQPPANS
jgi:hypothetical protein